jgi:hypothetical protein
MGNLRISRNGNRTDWPQVNGGWTSWLYAVACSADGNKMVALEFGGYIWVSNNNGGWGRPPAV